MNFTMHPDTFEHLTPSEAQLRQMTIVRAAFAQCADDLMRNIPDDPDRTYLLRKLRECAMWANVAITRHPDGAPRQEGSL